MEDGEVDDPNFFSIEQLLWEDFQLQEDIEDEEEEIAHEEAQLEAIITRHKSNLTLAQRRLIVDNLLLNENDGDLKWGFQSKFAREVGVHKSTINRIYKDAMKQRSEGHAIDVMHVRYGRCGRKPKHYSDDFLQSVPLHLRTTIRSFVGALKIPHCTVYRLLKKGKLRSHTSSTHPRVTEAHKLTRMKWVLGHIYPPTPTTNPIFMDMQNVIHIDEKWFYINPEMSRFYLLPFEDDPYRCCQSKRFRIKIMFMGVIGRPIYDSHGIEIHDGKYGIYPFVHYVRAKKRSCNREAGTIETKPVESVTKKVIRRMLIDNVIPSIMQNWPAYLPRNIQLQQDNARPHISDDDMEFKAAATHNGFNIQLVNQPSQSPVLNLLDLCLFRALQSLQNQSFPQNVDELITRVQDAYDFYDTQKIKFAWLQLQYVMTEILKDKGGNNYKNPHHGKTHLQRIGKLPENVEVEQSLLDEAVNYLNEREVPIVSNVHYFNEGEEVDAD